jgi:enoyl-CoA hydratase/carnithine racemase
VSTPVETTCADGVGTILLNRPEVMNAITVELAEELESTLRELAADETVSVIVIRGAGGNFCAGGDFQEVQRLRAQGPDALRGLFVAFRRALSTIDEVDVPVVAVVEGNATAGGFELVQAVDIAVAHEDARLCDNHVNFAQVPGGGGSQRLPRLLGRQAALAHLLTGEPLTGTRAAELGIVQKVFPADGFDSTVDTFVARIAAKDRATLRSIKRLVVDGLGQPLDTGLDLELETVVAHITRGADEYAAAFTTSSREDAS